MNKLILTICLLIFTVSVAHSKEIVLRCEDKNNMFIAKGQRAEVEIDLAANKLWVEGVLFTIVTKGERTIVAEKEVADSDGVITIRLDRYDGFMKFDAPEGRSGTAYCKKYRKMF